MVPARALLALAALLSPLGLLSLPAGVLAAHRAVFLRARPRLDATTRWSGAAVSSRVALAACSLAVLSLVMSAGIARGTSKELAGKLQAAVPDVLVVGEGAAAELGRAASPFARVVPLRLMKVLVGTRVLDVAAVEDGARAVAGVAWPPEPALLVDSDTAEGLAAHAGEAVEVRLDPAGASSLVARLVVSNTVLDGRAVLQAGSLPSTPFGVDAAVAWTPAPADGACAAVSARVRCTSREELEHAPRAMQRLAALLVSAFLAFLVVLAASVMGVSVTALATERRQQLATLRALGMSAHGVASLLVRWALGLALRGAVVGALAASAWAAALSAWPIPLDPRTFFIERLHVELAGSDFALAAGCLAVSALAASLRPALRAAGLDVVEALRT